MLFKDFKMKNRRRRKVPDFILGTPKSTKYSGGGVDSGVSYDYVDYWSDIAHFPRAELIRYSNDYPEVVDARFTAILHGDEFE